MDWPATAIAVVIAVTDPTSPVVLGTDGSAASEAATVLAFDEASRRAVELIALHAWSSVSTAVAEAANTPVIVVRPQEA